MTMTSQKNDFSVVKDFYSIFSDFFTFTKEIFSLKRLFLCSVCKSFLNTDYL